MEKQDPHFIHILLYYIREGKNASQPHNKLCGHEALKSRLVSKFRSGEFSLKNAQRFMNMELYIA